MTTYPKIDYLDSLTSNQINSAILLAFAQYVPPINSLNEILDWDFAAFFSTSVDSGSSRDMFVFDGTAGATYDIFSESFFDPFVLQLFDEQGKPIATNDFSSDAYGIDHVEFVAPYDGRYYVDASWHQSLTSIEKAASLSVYEDLDTIPPTFPRSPPSVFVASPINIATDVPVDSNIVLTFDESIQRGSGLISIRTAENFLVEAFDAESSNNLSISGKTLTINPTNHLSNNTQYFVTLDSGSIESLIGNTNAEIGSYSFTTIAKMPDISTANIDRIFNWGESKYSHLFFDHPESMDVLGYHARIYSNGNAVGEQNGNIYFYDGGADGTGDIVLVGRVVDFLPLAISAGF